MSKPLVYVAGPITKGESLAHNVHNMIRDGAVMVDEGIVTPLVPYNGIWEFILPKGNDWWYAYDNELLKRCDAVFVRELPDDKTSGVYAEIELAETLGIPVFYFKTELYDWTLLNYGY